MQYRIRWPSRRIAARARATAALTITLICLSIALNCRRPADCKVGDATCSVLPMLLYSKVAVATNLYLVNNVTGSLSEYSIDRSTGLLTAIGSATGMAAAVGVQVDPLGRFVYVTATPHHEFIDSPRTHAECSRCLERLHPILHFLKHCLTIRPARIFMASSPEMVRWKVFL